MQLEQLKKEWVDNPDYHAHINDLFSQSVNENDELREHRDFVQNNAWGFGERSFWYLWKLISDEMPKNFSFLEVGVFRSATLSVIKLLRPDAKVFGITPLDTSGGVWESNYADDIKLIHDKFNNGKQPHLFIGRSDNEEVVKSSTQLLYDVVYIDGSHEYEDVKFDLETYSKVVKVGGYFVIDDANTEMSMKFGFFQGIADVTKAKIEWQSSDFGKSFEFVFSVVHISVFKRVK